ncbi:MAG: FHA domain-containing protein [Planctomycetota bacterium]
MAILEYENRDGSRSFKVRPGQSLLIGASNSSDIQLANADHVAPQHCEVTFASGTLAIKNLTHGQRSVHVNGSSVNRQRLSDGDQIDIGDNRLRVVLRDEPEDQPATEPVAAPIAGATVVGAAGVAAATSATSTAATSGKVEFPVDDDDDFLDDNSTESSNDVPEPEPKSDSDDDEQTKFEILENGVRRISVASFLEEWQPKLEAAKPAWRYGLLINHRLAKFTFPAPESLNLLAEFPENLSKDNDLYLVLPEDPVEFWKTHRAYDEEDACVLLMCRGDKAISEDDLKFLAAWFATPAKLMFNLDNGTNVLLEKIFSLVDWIVFSDPTSNNDVNYVADALVTDEQSFASWIIGTKE